jgi:hypothetical protein
LLIADCRLPDGEWAQEFPMRTLLALIVGCSISTSALAMDVRHDQARIRPQDPRLAELIRIGANRSATLRDIVRRIESGHLFVYVAWTPNMRASLAGKLTWITKSGAFRYVKVTINTEQSSEQMIATIAHELQHALEVSALYRRIGRPSAATAIAGFETAAAQAAGWQVRRELVVSASTSAVVAGTGDHPQS